MKRFVPSTCVKNKHTSCPWFNEDCVAAFSAKYKAFSSMQKCASKHNKAAYHAVKYKYQEIIRSAKASYADEFENRLKSCNNKDWWKLLKSAIPRSSKSSISNLQVNNSVFAESSEKAEAFNKFFASQSNLDSSGCEPPTLLPNPKCSISTIVINRKTVLCPQKP